VPGMPVKDTAAERRRAPAHDGPAVDDLPRAAHEDAADVLARGMRDNPLHVELFGPDPERRVRRQARLMRAFFAHTPTNEPLGVWQDGRLVACTGVLLDGGCRPAARESLAMAPAIASLGPVCAARMAAWLRVWREHDPDEPHAHLGPFAVDRHLQGRGIGTVLLAEHCRRLDATGTVGYLETDKSENVHFYERGGYRVIGEAPTLGVTAWFMRRPPVQG
jgi:ribosomal protein S18 acetylase RimI-like enzyme